MYFSILICTVQHVLKFILTEIAIFILLCSTGSRVNCWNVQSWAWFNLTLFPCLCVFNFSLKKKKKATQTTQHPSGQKGLLQHGIFDLNHFSLLLSSAWQESSWNETSKAQSFVSILGYNLIFGAWWVGSLWGVFWLIIFYRTCFCLLACKLLLFHLTTSFWWSLMVEIDCLASECVSSYGGLASGETWFLLVLLSRKCGMGWDTKF